MTCPGDHVIAACVLWMVSGQCGSIGHNVLTPVVEAHSTGPGCVMDPTMEENLVKEKTWKLPCAIMNCVLQVCPTQ